MPEIEPFRFDINLLRTCYVGDDPKIPEDAEIRMVVDPSYSAREADAQRHKDSDKSGILVFYRYPRERDGIPEVHVIAGDAQLYEGIRLPTAVLNFAKTWIPKRISIENFGTGAFDLLREVIQLLARLENFPICEIRGFSPNNGRRAKPNRIRRIHEDLLTCDPVALKIYGPRLFGQIAGQAEAFLYEEDDNRGRDDSLLDCLGFIVSKGDV